VVICTIEYDAFIGVLAVNAKHAFCTTELKALKLAVGNATETTVATVKPAASSENDCDTPDTVHAHNASGRTCMDVG